MLNKAREVLGQPVAVTYQLIGDNLYRSKHCPFPARCKGIEYFLLKLGSDLPDFEIVVNTYDWPHMNR